MEENPVLTAREQRWHARRALVRAHGVPLLTLCLNIPGPDKNPPGAAEALALLRHSLLAALAARPQGLEALVHEDQGGGADGPYWHLLCALPAPELKRLAVAVESEHPLGRLADADVLDANAGAVSREHLGLPPRRCFLCEELPAVCRRQGTHTAQEVMDFARQLLNAAQRMASAASATARASSRTF